MNLVQYYLVDRTLKMRQGKACAQCCHAALYAERQFLSLLFKIDVPVFIELHSEWETGQMAKVVLKATTEDLQRALDEIKWSIEVRDAGNTELEPNTRTVVVLPVMKKEEAPEWIQKMKLL